MPFIWMLWVAGAKNEQPLATIKVATARKSLIDLFNILYTYVLFFISHWMANLPLWLIRYKHSRVSFKIKNPVRRGKSANRIFKPLQNEGRDIKKPV
jgi:hypothetical protein